MIATHAFEALAVESARSQGLPEARIVSVAHPIGGVDEERLRRRAEAAVDGVLGVLAGAGRRTSGAAPE